MATDVQLLVHKGLGRITLNRPKALNALNHEMVRDISAALKAWEHDNDVRAVVINGAGDRGLCAGGDIRTIYDDARSGGTESRDFWADEYRLNRQIARFPKPYIAIMDGMVMGGGIGVSAHGSIRVVTERSRLGMPEVGIGLVPDVGGTYLLSRAPGLLGTHVALTTRQLSAADALHCGFADHYVPSEWLEPLLEALGDGVPSLVLPDFSIPAPASELAAQQQLIDACYSAPTVDDIIERLRAQGEEGASVAKEIASKSPTALQVTLRALRSAAQLPDLESVLRQEFRVSTSCLRSHDLPEGIRAQIIDKDHDPQWKPRTLADVDQTVVDGFFSDLGDGGLRLNEAGVVK